MLLMPPSSSMVCMDEDQIRSREINKMQKSILQYTIYEQCDVCVCVCLCVCLCVCVFCMCVSLDLRTRTRFFSALLDTD